MNDRHPMSREQDSAYCPPQTSPEGTDMAEKTLATDPQPDNKESTPPKAVAAGESRRSRSTTLLVVVAVILAAAVGGYYSGCSTAL